ncbi:MAG: DNA polymerase III subunit alpha [Candidatus Pristimantibacillus lignocellulolyticus]|uniref:DNA-directed DNA polymerase n=1 Tax=Candidatus Pristimantibacillus lignocellulolyticus TaxID=2994561 RepID=A0A9J6ZA49_9BACL|nr:MAG: DNA polymerase III subunit alpha [Candidatus Pristimantibacillus lignocellulolyticus]
MSTTMAEQFVHLHVHSEYSLLDGAARIKELVKAAASKGMKALALTDHGVMYGAVAFYKACLEYNIKPIIGCEIYFTAGSRFEKGNRKENPIYHLILLAANEQGYRNLMKIVSTAQVEGMHYKPRADYELLSQHSEGIICLSACLGGEVNQHLLHQRIDEAKAAALRHKEIFGDRYYLEIQNHGMLEQKQAETLMIQLAQELDIPLVATNDVHYIDPRDAAMQEVLICIGTGKSLQDEDRLKIETDQLYLRTGAEMLERFQHVPEAIRNTAEIAARCNVELQLGRANLPQFWPIPPQQTSNSFLRELCLDGMNLRFADSEQWLNDTKIRQTVTDRLNYELAVIEKMGYEDYFLIVWDFIRFAKERHIAVGPGRGSSAGSLVAYTLQITDVDPIKYKLLFERFLNPERVSMPDIDIDFDDERRDEVIQYVAAKYGDEHVAQIITFGTMAAKAAIRDVGRAMNISFQEVDRAAKLIPNQLGITLEHALNQSQELRTAYDGSANTRRLIDMAIKVEGMPRHSSTHAAGVVIAASPLTEYTPLQVGSEDMLLTQYSMEHLESIGLLKMDFLGLRTLSILGRAHRWVEEINKKQVNFHQISDDDPLTYEMLGKGETTGIFQLESPGVRRVLRDMKPSNFEDIVSVLALYRPGPMEFIPKYIEGKHGKIVVEYPHDSLRHILQDTYGIIVYQEQIMQIASHMAGFSLGEADLLRRAVSKKKREVLDEERAHFVQGSITMGYDELSANRVYDMIVRFADYGFPRAHAVAYGVLAFRTAWFKAHHPIIFMASMLASVAGNMRKAAQYVDECSRMGIAVLPPCINNSGLNFAPTKEGIRFGLAAIKNVGTQAIESIVSGRREKPYLTLLDFCKRVDLRVVNKRVLESLILAGAFDQFEGHRAQLLAALDDTLEAVTKWKKERDDLQIELFGFEEIQNWDVELPNIRSFTMTEQLEHEYELLGMYLSGHPLDELLNVLQGQNFDSLIELYDREEGYKAVVPVRIASIRPYMSKNGQAMAFAEVEDRIVRIEAVVFASTWRKCSTTLVKDSLVLMLASVQKQEDEIKLIVDDVVIVGDEPIEEMAKHVDRLRGQAERWQRNKGATKSSPPPRREVKDAKPTPTQKIFIKINEKLEQPTILAILQNKILQHQGDLVIVLFYERTGQIVALSEQYRASPNEKFIVEVEHLLGKGSIVIK